MVTDELREFVKKEKKKGLGDSEIRTLLDKEGWEKTDVDEVLGGNPSIQPETPKTQMPHDAVFRKKVIVLGVLLIVLIIGLVLIIMIGGGGRTSVETPSSTENSTQVDQAVQPTTNYISDCGGKECFEENFSNCTISTIDIIAEGAGGVNYTIVGPAENGCEMDITYIGSANKDLEGKTLNCVFDNSLDSDIAVAEVFKQIYSGDHSCTGSLVSVLEGGGIYSGQ
jgi:hypothetical protein